MKNKKKYVIICATLRGEVMIIDKLKVNEENLENIKKYSAEQKKTLTGYASIDQPWLAQYDVNGINEKSSTNKTVWEATEEKLEEYSEIPLIEYFGRTISRKQFHDYVETWAKSFKALGVKPGDVIPIYTPATPEAYAMLFAANAIGAIPYYQKLAISKSELDKETGSATIAVAFDSLWNNVKDVFSQDRFKKVIIISAADSMKMPLKQLTKIKANHDNKKNNIVFPKNSKYIFTKEVLELGKKYKGDYKEPFKPNQTAVITTSSGTTSNKVKGIMDTNESVLASLACTINAQTGYTRGKKTLTCFPPTASTSINCLQLLPTFTGGTIIFDPRVDINHWYDQVMKYKPDITISTGSVWEKFVDDVKKKEANGKKHDLSWVDYFIMGGAGTTPEILRNMNKVLKERGAQREINAGYGFSEVFGVLSVVKYDGKYREEKNDKKVISVGIPLPGYKVGIFDENGNELEYGSGKRGELWISAPSNMHGYYNKQELTNNTIKDGWIRSGDLCEIDKDGNIYCYGRLKNSIEINNNKTYLFDISNDVRTKFGLHDIMVEKKKLDNDETSLVVYFVQNENNKKDNKEIVEKIDNYLNEKNIIINGYKEFDQFLPIDPTTLKTRTKDLNGFIKYVNGKKFDISYDEVTLDTYRENKKEITNKTFRI